jgi:hypothetical protein
MQETRKPSSSQNKGPRAKRDRSTLFFLFVILVILLIIFATETIKTGFINDLGRGCVSIGRKLLHIQLGYLIAALVGLVFVVPLLSRLGEGLTLISHWHKLIEGLQDSPQRVYTLLEQAVIRREMRGTHIFLVSYREGGAFSAQRDYLQVRRKEHVFEICAAPFGSGFFVSWWLSESPGCLFSLPFIGPVLIWLFRPETYYRVDTALMFQSSVHSAVLEIIDQITQAKGLRALSEEDRKPIMKDLFKLRRKG